MASVWRDPNPHNRVQSGEAFQHQQQARIPPPPPLSIPPISSQQNVDQYQPQVRARNGRAKSSAGAALLDLSPPFAHKGHKRSGFWSPSLGWLPILLAVAGFLLLALSFAWLVNHNRAADGRMTSSSSPASILPLSVGSAWSFLSSSLFSGWLGHSWDALSTGARRPISSIPTFSPTGAKKRIPASAWTPAGPMFRFGVPDKTEKGTACDVVAPGPLKEAWEPSCYGTFCFRRTSKPSVDSTGRVSRLYLEGTLRDSSNGNPIPGANLHLWQTDVKGTYGSLHSDPGMCRAVIRTDKNGRFAFETGIPGSYGISSSLLPLGIDFPPFGPRHIHALVEHPDYPVFSTQLYFEDDAARAHDWRDATFRDAKEASPLKAMDPSLTLKLERCSRRLTGSTSSAAKDGAAETPMYCSKGFELVLPTEIQGQPSKTELAQLRAVSQMFAEDDTKPLLYEELAAEVTAKGAEAGKQLVRDINARLAKAKNGRYESKFALKSLKSAKERVEDAAKARITAVVCSQMAPPIALCRPWVMAATKPAILWPLFLYFVALPVALIAFVAVWVLRRQATRRLTKAVSKRLMALLDRVGLGKMGKLMSAGLQRAKFA